MPRGRQRRLRNFAKRVQAFSRDIKREKSVKKIKRDVDLVTVGTGVHRRLIKKNALDFANLNKVNLALFSAIANGGIKPQNYELVKVTHLDAGGIGAQEYFEKPTVRELGIYFYEKSSKKRGGPKALTKEQALLCKRVANKDKSLDLSKVEAAFIELQEHCSQVFTFCPVRKNIVVFGIRNGKIRLAIIDV